MKLPPQPSVPRGRIPAVMRRLARAIDGLEEPAIEKIAEDQQEDPFQVLIATMLSAQTKDAVTHAASTRLFARARTPAVMLELTASQIERLIYPVSFYRHKAVHVLQTCAQLLTRYGGKVPSTMDELLTLPGVGRKTANVVRSVALDEPGFPVDTHVLRLVRRLAITAETDPVKVESDLDVLVPARERGALSLRLILHGRRVCVARKPRCGGCVLASYCPKIGVIEMPARVGTK